MLRLEKITKDYKVADSTVRALKGLTLSFRQNEFVSVLGPSGCGKTTLLNLIGGLDQYTSGNLFVGGRSTKEFKDRDWDVYRNHRIGFIFQSYNLIPHQTVLGNVELALTIAGMNKQERVEKAKKALDKVGLSDQYYKRPNQLSGGQSQRVAIARALVNDPEILLADEPTGALDTKTSVQIMELVKEIAKEKLVIMVTHNPDLAEKYSTRIIKLLDGELIDDSNPFSPENEIAEVKQKQQEAKQKEAEQAQILAQNGQANQKPAKKEKAKMSFFTAFRLSLQNLFTKKARTIMTAIAGSIGIIGISLVLSISYGVRTFISDMQSDMLSGHPITVSETALNYEAIMSSMTNDEKREVLKKMDGQVNVRSLLEYLAKRVMGVEDFFINNTITQDYVDYILAMPDEYLAAVLFDYGLDITNNVFTDMTLFDGDIQNVSLSLIKAMYTSLLIDVDEAKFGDYAAMITSLSAPLAQSFNDGDYVLSQYNVLHSTLPKGELPQRKEQIMIVLNSDREIADLVLAQLGYYSQNEFLNVVYKMIGDERYDEEQTKERFSYEELLGKTFTWYPNDTVFDYGGSLPGQVFEYTPYGDGLSKTASVELEVVAIIEPKDGVNYGSLESGFYYTEELAKYVIQENINSKIAAFSKQEIKNINGEIIKDAKVITGSPKYDAYTVAYEYTYFKMDGTPSTRAGIVGNLDLMSVMGGTPIYTITTQQLGGVDMASNIYIYPLNMTQKTQVLKYLDRWNSGQELTFYSQSQGEYITMDADREEINYTDPLSLIFAMIDAFISIVTYALVGFTSLALLVSCVMIAIITYVSVVERIKEIGVIRSLGGRKKDVSHLFNAETFIIGLTSGLIGIGFTYLFSFVFNLIIKSLSGISRIAIFPWHYAVIMVLVSIGLTVISGLMPSRSAAKKDPVVALRSE